MTYYIYFFIHTVCFSLSVLFRLLIHVKLVAKREPLFENVM